MDKNDTVNKRILIADDHAIVRNGIQFIITDIIENTEILHASSLIQVREYFLQQTFDVLILDAQFPDGNSIKLIPELKEINPTTRILVFTSFEEENYALKFIKAGADGFISKMSTEEEIENAIQQIVNTGSYFSTLTAKLMALSVHNPDLLNPLSQLSERELQIPTHFVQSE